MSRDRPQRWPPATPHLLQQQLRPPPNNPGLSPRSRATRSLSAPAATLNPKASSLARSRRDPLSSRPLRKTPRNRRLCRGDQSFQTSALVQQNHRRPPATPLISERAGALVPLLLH